MKRVLGLFQRREDAWATAEDLRAAGIAPAVQDAGLLEDSQAGRRIGRGVVLGLMIGVIAGLVTGLVAMLANYPAWLPVLVLAVVALSAFCALAGGLFGAAASEQVRSSGESLAVRADVPDEQASEVASVLKSHDAAAVEEIGPARRNRRPRLS